MSLPENTKSPAGVANALAPNMKYQKQDLEQRIKDINAECEALALKRAEELKLGTGLPVQVIQQMLAAKGCRCMVALDIFETRRRDAEIAARQVA